MKVVPVPSVASSQGKTSCTRKLTAELINPTKEIASPRTLLGNNSEKSTHITGPIETAKEATKPRIPNNTMVGLIFIAPFKQKVIIHKRLVKNYKYKKHITIFMSLVYLATSKKKQTMNFGY